MTRNQPLGDGRAASGEGKASKGGAPVRRVGCRRQSAVGSKPGGPHGRLRGATNPRGSVRSKPSKSGRTTRTERARDVAISGPGSPGVDAQCEYDGEAVFERIPREEPGGHGGSPQWKKGRVKPSVSSKRTQREAPESDGGSCPRVTDWSSGSTRQGKANDPQSRAPRKSFAKSGSAPRVNPTEGHIGTWTSQRDTLKGLSRDRKSVV